MRAAGTVRQLSHWRRQLAELRAWKPAGITTFSELIPQTAAIAEALGLPYHSPTTAQLLTDKRAQRARLSEAGLDSTRSAPVLDPVELTDAVEQVGLPAVLKPVVGRGSMDTHLLTTPADVDRCAAELSSGRAYVLEEYLRGEGRPGLGDYVSVETVLGPQGPRHLAVTGKFPQAAPFRECGQFWPSGLTPDQNRRIVGLTSRILAALGVRHGITHTEFKLTADGPRLIEVNGRLGGWIAELTQRATGADLLSVAADLACGGEGAEAVEYRDPRVCFQFWNQPPLNATELRSVTGVREVRSTPGVQRYLNLVPPGPLEPGVLTQRLDLTAGWVKSHHAMHQLLAAALEPLSYTFADADGCAMTLAASELPSSPRGSGES
ncbi:ATP-grasp domain-containing protein [Kitasatospora sp. MAP5-34]|uniref:ATP-grasp domain-containing protein n=1 Tax=Kitasatospora sp. MAP5-34 TaxID=3035102 RepID=UPI002476230D|nr:ATP-grasp domain-containing protein [Kitasatospora sp. MAP5-34]